MRSLSPLFCRGVIRHKSSTHLHTITHGRSIYLPDRQAGRQAPGSFVRLFSPRSSFVCTLCEWVDQGPSVIPGEAEQALLPRLSQCIHYRRSRLAEHAHHTITEGNLSPDFARFHSLSLSWEPAKVELVAQSEGRKRASSSVFIFVIIHSSIPHSLPEQNEILPPLSTRTKVTGMQTNRRLVRLFGKHSCRNRALPHCRCDAMQRTNAMGMGGERARDSFVTVKVAGRKEGRRPLFPLDKKTFNPSNE